MQALRDGGGGADPAERVESVLLPDDIFKTLSNRRRRHVLYYLRHIDGTVTIRDLSEQLAAWENGTTTAEVVPGERKRLYTALHQTHLPKMDALGIVTYGRNRGTVRMTDSVREFDAYLDAMSADGHAWHSVYLAVSAVLGLLAAGGAVGLEPLASVGGYGYALVTAAVVAGVAAVQYLLESRQPVENLDLPPTTAGTETGTADDD
ncbi:MAG: hypothetical protein V5A30_02900 [Haloarculaceae archaeon]